MSVETAVQLALAIPLVATLLIVLAGRWPNLRETVTIVAAVLTFIMVARLFGPVFGGARPEIVLFDMFPGLSIAFKVEPLGMVFAGIASFLWIVTSFYSIGYMRGHHEQNQTRFFAAFAVAIFSALGVAFSANLLTLFVFYEVLSLSTYPLVAHHGDEEAKRGARVYLGILLTTSIGLFLPAIIWVFNVADTLDFVPGGILAGKANSVQLTILLLLFGYGIGKAALMPLHRWLPAAMVAPTPVSALLHAVAVVKAGVFTILKVSFFTFGLDTLSGLAGSEILMYVAAATILIASLVAMRQDNLKRRLAYSTVSQLSYIVLGAMLATRLGFIGGGMHIVTHAFGKITLFFCAGSILVASHKTEISDMRGIGRAMPFTMTAFLIGSLSVIGLPPFGGLWSKWYLMLGSLDAGEWAMMVVLLISSFLNVAYLLPIAARGFFSAPKTEGEFATFKEAPAFCVLAQSLTALGCIALFFYAEPVYDLLNLLFVR